MKNKYPLVEAQRVANEIVKVLTTACSRVCVAGSIRRGKSEVGDVEIVYVPKVANHREEGEMFASSINLADVAIRSMEQSGILARRKNVDGGETYGPKNKLMIHSCGVPVDLFATTEKCWWNYLVCRTGGAETNMAIATRAKAKGWKWNPYGEGFSRTVGTSCETRAMTSENEVFEFVGMKPLRPEGRI